MGLLDMLFGRTKLPKSKPERLFAVSTACPTIITALRWQPSGRAGICLKPVSAGDFGEVAEELSQLVELAVRDTGTRLETVNDGYGFRWFVFQDEDFEDLVTLVHLVARTLEEQGYGTQLLSAVFRFRLPEGSAPAYLVYNYKRGNFYPFVPVDKKRDNSAELRAAAILDRELPVEKKVERWYALWDCPV